MWVNKSVLLGQVVKFTWAYNFMIIVNSQNLNYQLHLHFNTVSPSKHELCHLLPVMSFATVLQLHVCIAIRPHNEAYLLE